MTPVHIRIAHAYALCTGFLQQRSQPKGGQRRLEKAKACAWVSQTNAIHCTMSGKEFTIRSVYIQVSRAVDCYRIKKWNGSWQLLAMRKVRQVPPNICLPPILACHFWDESFWASPFTNAQQNLLLGWIQNWLEYHTKQAGYRCGCRSSASLQLCKSSCGGFLVFWMHPVSVASQLRLYFTVHWSRIPC